MMIFCFSCRSAPIAAPPDAGGVNEEVFPVTFAEIPPAGTDLPVSIFNEIWTYVINGSENALKSNLPISDVVYFGAEVDRYGHLAEVPKRSKLANFTGKVHMSVACFSAGLIHFIIEPGSKARSTLIQQIIKAARDYDGLNIDFENVPAQDGENFLSFLSEVSVKLGREKIFSVCVPARTRSVGAYNYSKIASISNRVFVMAYDEHWSTSAPGPVASMKWCRNVAAYALQSIGSEKLVMGIPFYGRAWGNTSTSRALVNATTERIKKEHGVQNVQRVNGIPTFTYDVLVKVTVFYEDEYSIATRVDMYRKQGVTSIGFWRLGQEAMAVWSALNLERHVAVK
jgi:spore germination protein YaaH